MKAEEYIHTVKEQLRAYDFGEFTEDHLEEDEEDLISIVRSHPVFCRYNELIMTMDMVVIVELEENTVDEIKSKLYELVFEDLEDEATVDGMEPGEELRLHILFVSSNASTPLATVVERNAVDAGSVNALPILVDLKNSGMFYYAPSGFGKSFNTLYEMGEEADKYFRVQGPTNNQPA